MATKVDLLKSFSTGQGIAGGLPNYVNYPTDHDGNYTALEATVNQMIDELNGLRALDTTIAVDALLPSGVAVGRFNQNAARITVVLDTPPSITVTSGKIYAAGRVIEITGASFDEAALDAAAITPTDNLFLNADETGLLALSEVASNATFDLMTFTYNSATNVITVPIDQLDPSRTLNTGGTINRIVEIQDIDGTTVGAAEPTIRLANLTGTDEDAGFFHGGNPSEFGWASQRSTSEGVGDPVVAADFTADGQLALREQARFMLVATPAHSIPENGTSSNNDVRWNTLPVTNVAGALERFEPESYLASTAFQSATGNVNCVIPAGLGGTWVVSAWFEIDELTGGTFIEARLFQNGGTTTAPFAEVRHAIAPTGSTKVCISGMFEAVALDTFQLEITHDATTAENILDGGLHAFRLGGVV